MDLTPDEAREVCRALFFLQGLIFAQDMVTSEACEIAYDMSDKRLIASAMESGIDSFRAELSDIVDGLAARAV